MGEETDRCHMLYRYEPTYVGTMPAVEGFHLS